MQAVENNVIYLTRGDTGTFNLDIKDDAGNPYDYTNDTVVFTMKKHPTHKTPIIQKTVTDGKVTILPADTDGLIYGQYYYDVQVTTQAGVVSTVIPPTVINICSEVTW